MKNLLRVSLVLLSGILLTACGNKSDENAENSANTVSKECKDAVEKYLDGADKQGEGDEVKAGDNIVVDYIGRLEDGTVFDTSIQSIAEACDVYSEYRDYTQGLSFEAGAGQMVAGFDNGVMGMKVGQTKTVQFGPEEGYGEYDKSLVVNVPISEVGDVSEFSEGDTVYLGMGYPAKILKITDKEITFDMNHELAGKNLIFDITLKENGGAELVTNIQHEETEGLSESVAEEVSEEPESTAEEVSEN